MQGENICECPDGVYLLTNGRGSARPCSSSVCVPNNQVSPGKPYRIQVVCVSVCVFVFPVKLPLSAQHMDSVSTKERK